MQYNCIQLLLVLFTQYVWLPLINVNRLLYHSVTFYYFISWAKIGGNIEIIYVFLYYATHRQFNEVEC